MSNKQEPEATKLGRFDWLDHDKNDTQIFDNAVQTEKCFYFNKIIKKSKITSYRTGYRTIYYILNVKLP